MKPRDRWPAAGLMPLTLAWLALLVLTLISVGLGEWFHGAVALQFLVAALVWLKGMLVARNFLESDRVHVFIRRILLGFIAFTPLALLLTAVFGRQFARWATL